MIKPSIVQDPDARDKQHDLSTQKRIGIREMSKLSFILHRGKVILLSYSTLRIHYIIEL